MTLPAELQEQIDRIELLRGVMQPDPCTAAEARSAASAYTEYFRASPEVIRALVAEYGRLEKNSSENLAASGRVNAALVDGMNTLNAKHTALRKAADGMREGEMVEGVARNICWATKEEDLDANLNEDKEFIIGVAKEALRAIMDGM